MIHTISNKHLIVLGIGSALGNAGFDFCRTGRLLYAFCLGLLTFVLCLLLGYGVNFFLKDQ